MAKVSKAIDKVRAQEAKELKEKGYDPVLTKSRWLLLKRPENLTEKQETKLADLLQYNLKSIRSYLLKEEFQLFWSYKSPYWAGQFLDEWVAHNHLYGRRLHVPDHPPHAECLGFDPLRHPVFAGDTV